MNKAPSFQELSALGGHLLSNNQFEKGLYYVSKHVTNFTGAQRCSIFIYEKELDELWTILSTGIEKLHIPSEKGIVGYVFRTKNSIIENNVKQNPHFLSDIDKQSGYTTHNIIACPINDINGDIIGVLELLNKESGFTEKDLDYINLFANYISSIMELAPFYIEKDEEEN